MAVGNFMGGDVAHASPSSLVQGERNAKEES